MSLAWLATFALPLSLQITEFAGVFLGGASLPTYVYKPSSAQSGSKRVTINMLSQEVVGNYV